MNKIKKWVGEGITSGIIFNPIIPFLPGISECWNYLFSSANSDSLEIEAFTGNLKVMIAAPSEVGIAPAVIVGRQGEFIVSTDPVNEPTVIQYEIEASAITQIVSSTFNGIVYKYAKDNFWYKINMGVG